jgi:hypothetical protein
MAAALKDPFGALNALKGSFRASRGSRMSPPLPK